MKGHFHISTPWNRKCAFNSIAIQAHLLTTNGIPKWTSYLFLSVVFQHAASWLWYAIHWHHLHLYTWPDFIMCARNGLQYEGNCMCCRLECNCLSAITHNKVTTISDCSPSKQYRLTTTRLSIHNAWCTHTDENGCNGWLSRQHLANEAAWLCTARH